MADVIVKWGLVSYVSALGFSIVTTARAHMEFMEGWHFSLLTEDPVTAFYAAAIPLGFVVGPLYMTPFFGTILAVPVVAARWFLWRLRPGTLGPVWGLAFGITPLLALLLLTFDEVGSETLAVVVGCVIFIGLGWLIERPRPSPTSVSLEETP